MRYIYSSVCTHQPFNPKIMKTLTLRMLLLVFFLFFTKATLLAQQSTTDKYIEGTISQEIPCAGDVVSGSFILHYIKFTNGNGKVFRELIQPMGVKLVGEKTGIIYNAVGVTQWKETYASDSEIKNTIYINNYHLVGTSKDGVNYKVHINIGFTRNADGDLTADFENASLTCE